MREPKFIEIKVPEPCSQNWGDMTPSGQGRFCDHCQKTVIDFTQWSDAELYGFFSKQKETVCGRFRNTQMGRRIHIPPQPHSQLYRMVVALGLTLIFTQGGATYAQSNAPLVQTLPVNTKDTAKTDSAVSPATIINANDPRVISIVHSEIMIQGAMPMQPQIVDWKIRTPLYVLDTVMVFRTGPLLPKPLKGITIPKLPNRL